MNAVTKTRNSFDRAIPPASEEEFINMARRTESVQPMVLTPVDEPAAGEGSHAADQVDQPAEAPAAAPRAARRPDRQAAMPAPANPWDALDDADTPLFKPIPPELRTDDEKQFSAVMSSAEHFMVSDTLSHLPNTSLRRYAREALLMRINFDRERLLKLHGKKA